VYRNGYAASQKLSSRGHESAVSEARRIFLVALFQAHERSDPDGVARAGEAFASLGDREVADHAFDVALVLATPIRDGGARVRVMALASRATTGTVTSVGSQ
jgi:hypothetical protein